jgi:hypothetical protein
MNPAEVEMHEVDRNGVFVVVNLFRVGVCKACEAAISSDD